MYRKPWVAEILGDRSVLSVALDVHMTATGSAERHFSDQGADVLALLEVEGTWKNHGICEFDDAVLQLIRAAIQEAKESTYANKRVNAGEGGLEQTGG